MLLAAKAAGFETPLSRAEGAARIVPRWLVPRAEAPILSTPNVLGWAGTAVVLSDAAEGGAASMELGAITELGEGGGERRRAAAAVAGVRPRPSVARRVASLNGWNAVLRACGVLGALCSPSSDGLRWPSGEPPLTPPSPGTTAASASPCTSKYLMRSAARSVRPVMLRVCTKWPARVRMGDTVRACTKCLGRANTPVALTPKALPACLLEQGAIVDGDKHGDGFAVVAHCLLVVRRQPLDYLNGTNSLPRRSHRCRSDHVHSILVDEGVDELLLELRDAAPVSREHNLRASLLCHTA